MRLIANILLFLILLIPTVAFGADSKNQSTSQDTEQNGGVTSFGLPFESPETEWGIGGTTIFYNHPNPDAPSGRMNETQLYGAYTQKSQVAIGLSTQQYCLSDEYKFSGTVKLDKWPDTIWGIGPDTSDDLEEKYTDKEFFLSLSLMKEIRNNLYIGPMFKYFNVSMKESDPDGFLQQNNIHGSDGATTTSAGIHLNWDERDNTFYPHNGFWFEITSSLYRKELGGDYNYFKFEVNHRNYCQIYGDHVIAYQGMAQFSSGTLPFQSLFKMGGSEMMRGIYEGRYRDKNHIAGQVEYRYPLFWHLGGVLYGAMAEVAPSRDAFNTKNIVSTWGTGLRYTVDEKEHINLRIDVGFNEASESSVYFTVKEAF